MKSFILTIFFTAISFSLSAQKHGKLIKGMYFQWGYNTEWYTKSNIRISMPNGTNFTLHHVKAHDSPDMDAIIESPGDICLAAGIYQEGIDGKKYLCCNTKAGTVADLVS